VATQLTVFNDALLILGQAPLDNAAPSPSNERSRVLNANWQGTVEYCLEQAAWDFAEERGALSRLTDAPAFGYRYYYALPDDCLRVTFVSESGMEEDNLLRYKVEKGRIATDAEAVYAKWVSSTAIDAPGRWSSTFARFVATELAVRTAPKLNASALVFATKEREKVKPEAEGVDSAQNPPQFRKAGSWARAARFGYRGNPEQAR
jgi:hypothetical protein